MRNILFGDMMDEHILLLFSSHHKSCNNRIINPAIMAPSQSARRLKKIIEIAIDDHVITQSEMDMIMTIAAEDSHIDAQEQLLLNQLHEMIENKMVRIIPG